ncbi:Calretinin [Branchiostoma belcheri]|nr:Calretinin [Branchiostoma belcheri]
MAEGSAAFDGFLAKYTGDLTSAQFMEVWDHFDKDGKELDDFFRELARQKGGKYIRLPGSGCGPDIVSAPFTLAGVMHGDKRQEKASCESLASPSGAMLNELSKDA